MAVLSSGFTYGQWSAVYNALSFAIAGMGSATIFFWLQLPSVTKNHRAALIVAGIVTAIATYHYIRIFNSWVDALTVKETDGAYVVSDSGVPFNDAYRYVDWLLTVPLLVGGLILVMELDAAQTKGLIIKLGVASAFMGALSYPGEIQDSLGARWWLWWALICYVVFNLLHHLAEAEDKQPEYVKGLVRSAHYVTAVSWVIYPLVYIIKHVGLKGTDATMYEQIGYSIADVTIKVVFGVLIWSIAARKSAEEDNNASLK